MNPIHSVILRTVSLACFILFTSIGMANENTAPRVKSIVVTPPNVEDDGSGRELVVQVEFVEPAVQDDTLKLIILPAIENGGEAKWTKHQSSQSFQIKAKDARVEVKIVLYVVKNGTIGIKAETSSPEKTNGSANIYWMPVTLREK